MHDTYVEESTSGGTPEKVAKMRGNVKKVGNKFTYTGFVSKVVFTVSMETKV